MVKECMTEDIFAPLTPAKPILTRPELVSINGGENHINEGCPTKGLQIFVDFVDLISLNRSPGVSSCDGAKFDTMGYSLRAEACDSSYVPENIRDGISSEVKEKDKVQIDSVGVSLVSEGPSTPEKNEKLRNGVGVDVGLASSSSSSSEKDDNLQNGVGLGSSTPSTAEKDKNLRNGIRVPFVGPSTPGKGGSKKRFQTGIDLNKTPPQKKRKLRRHIPKILDDSKPKRTPKAPKPKPLIKRKFVRKNNSKITENVVHEMEEKADRSCKRGLDFGLENQGRDGCIDATQTVDPMPENSNSPTLVVNLAEKDGKLFVYQYERRNKRVDDTVSDKFTDENGIRTNCKTVCRQNSLQVYKRIFKENQCLGNSRKCGPNFPRIFKKGRTRRRKATFYTAWRSVLSAGRKVILQPPNRKLISNKIGVKRLKLKDCTRNCSATMISPTEEQKRCAMNDLESFKCVMAMSPLVTSRRKRSTRFTRISNCVRRDEDCTSDQPPSSDLPKEVSAEKQMILHFTDKEKVRKQRQNKPRSSPNSRLSYDESSVDHNFVDVLLQMFEHLSISENCWQLVVRDENVDRTVVPFKKKSDPLKKSKLQPKIVLDQETERVFALLMDNGGSTYDEEAEQDPEKKAYWERERHILEQRVDTFLDMMSQFQGDRHFSKWSGSVVDSVVGAYLTQNVSDILSSSAFMCLAARFPCKNWSEKNEEPEVKEIEANPQADEDPEAKETESDPQADYDPEATEKETSHQVEGVSSIKKTEGEHKDKSKIDWDNLRRTYSKGRPRTYMTRDAVDWEAVRRASVDEISETIKVRGMNNILAQKIKKFLDRLVQDHGSMDLEWLRDVPPQDAKDFLLSIYGIGLKSVECIRLLTLNHVAFPVDTNVGRVAVRLGWVPLQPLPESLQLHLLESYPLLDSIQKYLYPRLCNLDARKLYLLHVHSIAFGKLFCTKRKPNCNACPMKDDCKHFASAFARPTLPAPETQNTATSNGPVAAVVQSPYVSTSMAPDHLETNRSGSVYQTQDCNPVVELPASPERKSELEDMEDLFKRPSGLMQDTDDSGLGESEDGIPILRLNDEALKQYILEPVKENRICLRGNTSNTWLLNPPNPLPKHKLKHVERLRTVHLVYELPDTHALLETILKVDRREPEDPSPYLLAVWEESLTSRNAGSSQSPVTYGLKSNEPNVYQEIVCSSSSTNFEEEDPSSVLGTLLIPVRSANKGNFPLNGTYFQVNEVFVDEESSRKPIRVPKNLIEGLQKRVLYCGASFTTMFKGLPSDQIQHACCHGFMCTRGFNRRTRYPVDLCRRFHLKTSMQGSSKKKEKTSKEVKKKSR